MVYTKVYYGSNYVIYDYSLPDQDERVLRAIESVEREIIKLQKLEKRGLIKKILAVSEIEKRRKDVEDRSFKSPYL